MILVPAAVGRSIRSVMGSKINEIEIVVAVIKNADGEVLIQKRNDKEYPAEDGRWELPGGGVEEGESFEEALARECKEEIGVEIRIMNKIALVSHVAHVNINNEKKYFVVHGFVSLIEKGEASPSSEEVTELRWIKIDEINGIRMPDNNKRFIWKSFKTC